MKFVLNRQQKNNRSFLLFFLLLFLISLYFLRDRKVAEASPESALYFEPASLTTNNDETFSLGARINPGNNQISAVEMHITFDAAKFHLTGINNNASAFPQILQAAQIDNNAGTASITLGVALSNPPSPVTTMTTVATLEFQTVGNEGSGNIAFVSGTQASALDEGANVLVQMNPASITIGRKYGNADFSILVSDWLQTKTSTADANEDGQINARDLGIMMSNWGS